MPIVQCQIGKKLILSGCIMMVLFLSYFVPRLLQFMLFRIYKFYYLYFFPVDMYTYLLFDIIKFNKCYHILKSVLFIKIHALGLKCIACMWYFHGLFIKCLENKFLDRTTMLNECSNSMLQMTFYQIQYTCNTPY